MSTRPQRAVTDGRVALDSSQPASAPEQPTTMTDPIPKLLVNATEAACYLSVSRAHIYRLLQAGELRSVHSMGAMRIPTSELASYVARLLREGADADVDLR